MAISLKNELLLEIWIDIGLVEHFINKEIPSPAGGRRNVRELAPDLGGGGWCQGEHRLLAARVLYPVDSSHPVGSAHAGKRKHVIIYHISL